MRLTNIDLLQTWDRARVNSTDQEPHPWLSGVVGSPERSERLRSYQASPTSFLKSWSSCGSVETLSLMNTWGEGVIFKSRKMLFSARKFGHWLHLTGVIDGGGFGGIHGAKQSKRGNSILAFILYVGIFVPQSQATWNISIWINYSAPSRESKGKNLFSIITWQSTR